MRYARGAVGITPFMAAHDRDYTQELVPFVETVLFMIVAPETLRGKKESGWAGQRRTPSTSLRPRMLQWGEIHPKIGADETLRNVIVAQDTRSALGRGTKRTASWETQETSDTCTVLPPVHGDPTDQATQATAHLRPHHATRNCSSSS